MAVRIQFRRGTEAQWSSANPTLAAGELGVATDTNKYKIGDGATAWNSLDYQSLPGNALAETILSAKGDLIVATANDTADVLNVGTNNSLLVADSTEITGLKWATTLSGITLTSPTVNGGSLSSSISSTATISGGTLNNNTITSPTITTGSLTRSVVESLMEDWNVENADAGGTINLEVLTASAWYFEANATSNWTLNVRGNSVNTLSSILDIDDSITVVFAATQGATAYYPTAFQIDGSAVTPKWQGGSAPSAGNATSIDVYVYTIIRTGTVSYTVFASQTQFA